MNAEIKSGENFLDEATKWVYADEKGVQVFALYGIGDGTEATPLYAVGGKRAKQIADDLRKMEDAYEKTDGGRGAVDSWIESIRRAKGSRNGNRSTDGNGRTAVQNDGLHGGSSGSNGRRASGRGTENQRGVKDQFSIREIKGEDGTDYGKGVYLDSTLLEGLTDAERKEMMRERVKELGGQTITAYDPNGEAVDIRIAAPSEKFRNRNGRRVPVTNDLARKNRDVKVKQESVVLADELIATSQYNRPRKAKYPHGWLDNNGKNDWQYWTTYIQDKNNTVWEATLNVAESANGVKYLYDIDPIEKVGQPVKSGTSTTLVGQPVKSGTSTTGDIVAQDQTESQAQIRSSTLSDRDVLRIAAQMAKNSESMLDIKREGDQHILLLCPRAFGGIGAKTLLSTVYADWEATLNVAESANGVKYLYDINPIEKVGPPVKSSSSTTFVGPPVKSGTSTTGDIVAQDQKESQAQIRSSTLSDRDVLRIAAQMAKNSESRSLTDGDRSAPLNFGYHEAKHLIQSCFIQIEAVSVLQCVLPRFLFRISVLDHECHRTGKYTNSEERSICGNEKFFPAKINRAVFCREGSFHFG